MLCPECEQPAPGGTTCDRCGHPIPERESFGGRGGHYLRVLLVLSAALFAAFFLVTDHTVGFRDNLRQLYRSGWLWFYLIVCCLPTAVGVYYWSMLRNEEITITDSYIARRSNWGDEKLLWAEIREYRRETILFRQTQLGRIAGLTRLLTDKRLVSKLPPIYLELVGPPDANGTPRTMRLEPGTIDDMPWLLKLIEERIGPPSD